MPAPTTTFLPRAALLACAVVIGCAAARCAAAEQGFLHDGDRVALVGDGLCELEGEECWLETALTAGNPGLKLRFRDFGWTGDTVACAARTNGLAGLQGDLAAFAPTVVVLGYGMTDSFAGAAGLDAFTRDLAKLLAAIAGDGRRLVVMSPIAHERLGAPWPDPAAHNADLARYADALAATAKGAGAPFIDLFHDLARDAERDAGPLTVNGIALGRAGYRAAARRLAGGLGSDVRALAATGAEGERTERLRRLILAKNGYFFREWRPRNLMYLSGGRKKEQGRHFAELQRITPFVAEQEALIDAALKEPGAGPLPAAPAKAASADHEPDPEAERRTFTVADGFEVSLFAADPLLAKPIQMAFDARGRLWVATSSTYPHVDPAEVPDDRVLVLEDADGDGRAEKSQVFAHGLFMPTGIELGDGGVYLADGDRMVFLRDRDGDGVCDQRQVLFAGFSTDDTHHILHTFRWGPGGDLFMMQSLYINSTVETAYGPRVLKSSGTWRLHTRDQHLEVYSRGTINPWGHCFNEWGDPFITDGANDEAVYQQIAGESFTDYFHRDPGGIGPISKRTGKLAGAELISGRHLPEAWRGRLVTSDFRANHVVAATLAEDGAGFVVTQVTDLIKSSDRAFRPVDVKMGPDGALYLADWYNPIINHGEVDFRDPRRDRTHGRIWRITATGRPLVERPKVEGATVTQLLALLRLPEDYARHQARRALQQLPPAQVVPELRAWVKALPAEAADTPRSQLEALWVMQGLDQVDPDLLGLVLRSREAGARAAAVRVLADWSAQLPDALDRLAALAADPHPRVRRDVVDALAGIPQLRSFQLALATLDQPADALMRHSVARAVKALAPVWTPALKERDFARLGGLGHLGFALQASGSADAVPALAELLKSGTVPAVRRGELLVEIARLGTPDQLAAVFAPTAPEPDAASEAALLAALRTAALERKARPSGDLAQVTALFDHPDAGVRTAALRLAAAWHVDAARAPALAIASDAGAAPALRLAALEVVATAGPAAAEPLASLVAGELPSEVRAAALAALVAADPARAAQAAAALFARDPGAVTIAFLRREGGGDALARLVEPLKPSAAAAQAALRALEQSGRNEPELARVLGALSGPSPQHPDAAQVAALAAEVRANGDAKRGKQVYQQLPCMACHVVSGTGGRIGPELTTIGASSPVDYLIDSLLEPDKQIKDGYHTVNVTTSDGTVVSGILVRQDERELVLRNAAGIDESIPAAKVKSKQEGKSLMPAGLTQGLSHQQFLDLVRYLASLGT